MFLEEIHSEGIGHISYLVGQGGEAAVIDPRLDCQVYIERALEHHARIVHIFETHLHEDFLSGAAGLSRLTGAPVHHHADEAPYTFGRHIGEGDFVAVGELVLRVLETPGHADDAISIVLSELDHAGVPLAVFTGDSLLAGHLGRVQGPADRARAAASRLHASIHEKLLPLGDHVVLLPAHGPGSTCGWAVSHRPFSTLGYERRTNPLLVLERDELAAALVGMGDGLFPPHHARMAERNCSPEHLRVIPSPPIGLHNLAFARAMDEGLAAVDIRQPDALGVGIIPGSIAMPLEALAAFGGWFLPPDRTIGLIADDEDYAAIRQAVTFLMRLGLDGSVRFLIGGIQAWETMERGYHRIGTMHAAEVGAAIAAEGDIVVLDVRPDEEVGGGFLKHSVHAFLPDVVRLTRDLPRDRPLVAFCGDGKRAAIAASLLLLAGHTDVSVCTASLDACRKAGCDIVKRQPT